MMGAGRTLYRKTKVEKTRDPNSDKKKRLVSINPQLVLLRQLPFDLVSEHRQFWVQGRY